MWSSTEVAFDRWSSYRESEEAALRWAELERLPTFALICRGFLQSDAGELSEADVSSLMPYDRTALIDRPLGDSGDPERFFQRMRHRFDVIESPCGLKSCIRISCCTHFLNSCYEDLNTATAFTIN